MHAAQCPMCSDSRDHLHMTLTSLSPFLNSRIRFSPQAPSETRRGNQGPCYTRRSYSSKKGGSMPRATQIVAELGLEAKPPGCQPGALSATLYLRYRGTGKRKN